MDFLEILERNFKARADRTALKDTSHEITYGELETLSGKVYASLKSAGIGKEDIVLINLPRGVNVVIAMVGVLRSGAAFIIMDAGDPAEKIKYVFGESGSKLLLTTEVYAEMMNEEPASGYVKREPHDLVYLIYTSGTTGHPKGVMQEYGVVEEIIRGNMVHRSDVINEDATIAFISPLTFTAASAFLLTSMYVGACSYIVPFHTVRNIRNLLAFIEKERIHFMFCTPSLFAILPDVPGTLKCVTLGGEATHDLFCENVILISGYAQSETGFEIASRIIDQTYQTVPAGRNQIGKVIMILDENDVPVAEGEPGEICIEAPYFRGYLGHPEMTEKAKRGGVFHTGDIGRILPNGDLLIMGRSDDMVKINGNRVEVTEIEEVAKRVTGLSWVGAKAFVTDSSAYVCLYYLEEPGMSTQELRSRLAEHLPYYMIPSRFMKLDSIPQNQNGKFSRKLLPLPPAPDTDYEEPGTENERIICEAIASVLGYDKVGANTDFYEIGGDSIKSILLVNVLPWNDFTVTHAYKGRTPREMARLYEESIRDLDINLDLMEEEAEKIVFPLTDKQQYFFDYQLYTPKSTMYNLPIMMRFLNNVDAQKLARSVETVMKTHPVFMTQFFFAEDGVMQHYVPFEPEIRVEEFSEAEMVDIMEDLIQPYKMVNSYMHRIRLFQTERGVYLFLDLHHCISDGTSANHLVRDIQQAYQGEPLKKDYYYAYLNRQNTLVPNLKEGYENYGKEFEEANWCGRLEFDNDSRDNGFGIVFEDVPVTEKALDDLANRYGLGKNPFIIASTILALSAATKKKDIIITWLYDGRVGALENSLVGLVIEDRPLAIRIREEMTLSDYFSTILKKIEAGVAYHDYSVMPDDSEIIKDDIICVIYQSKLLDFSADGELQYQLVTLPSKYEAAENVMDVELVDGEPFPKLVIVYNNVLYNENTIHKYKKLVVKAACRLAEFSASPDTKIVSLIDSIG